MFRLVSSRNNYRYVLSLMISLVFKTRLCNMMIKPKTFTKAQKDAVISQLKAGLAQRKEIIFSYLHGSFVDGRYFRDVDVAVYVDEKQVSQDDALFYGFRLSAALEEKIKLPIDAKVLNYAPIGFKYHITTGKILTCRDDEMRAYVVGIIWSLYFDQLPTMRRFLKEMLEK